MLLKRLHTLIQSRNDFKSKYENICINDSFYICIVTILGFGNEFNNNN